MRTLQELNLVDDFLMNRLTSHKVYGEKAAGYILSCILERQIGKLTVVPQYFCCGEDRETHGVRLDVYLDEQAGGIFDIEPDQNSGVEEQSALPRRVRFYHAKLDAGSLASGEEYRNLRNVVVIFITTYDPFGLGRMVYTIRNGCVEEPDMPYDDGAQTVFLYTRGNSDGSPEELRQLLQYMEHSVAENAVTQELEELHRMVTEIRQDGEAGLAYMKSFEIEQRIRREGIKEGINAGLIEGRMEEIVEMGRQFGQSEEEILRLLQEKLNLTREQAETALQKY